MTGSPVTYPFATLGGVKVDQQVSGERAYGVAPNACTNPTAQLSPATFFSRVKAGMTSWATLNAVGQPDRRLGSTFSYCSTDGTVTVQFSSAGKVTRIIRP